MSQTKQVLNSLFLVCALLFFANDTQAQLAWAQFTGSVPPTAVAGGEENGQNLYIGRAVHTDGTVHPGKVFRSGNDYICNYGYGGEEIVATAFEILVKKGDGVRLKWVPVEGSIPLNAVAAGTENGQNLYVGRAKHTDGTVHPGKVFSANGRYICNYGYGGQELIAGTGFEVLVAKSPSGIRKNK